MNEIVLKPSLVWRTVAHHLEHLDPKKLKSREKAPQMVECYGHMVLDLQTFLNAVSLHKKNIENVHHVRLRPPVLVALAARRILTRGEFRLLNGYWKADPDDRTQDVVVLYNEVNLGVSYDESVPASINEKNGTVDGPRLCIPTMRAPSEELMPFIAAYDDLLRRVHEDHTSGAFRPRAVKFPAELSGYTFIFNNLGALGHVTGGSRLTPHTAAMLNMGVIEVTRAHFQLFFDHRMCDGSMVTRFLKALHAELVESIVTEINELAVR